MLSKTLISTSSVLELFKLKNILLILINDITLCISYFIIIKQIRLLKQNSSFLKYKIINKLYLL